MTTLLPWIYVLTMVTTAASSGALMINTFRLLKAADGTETHHSATRWLKLSSMVFFGSLAVAWGASQLWLAAK
jgi:hypothetical protein